MNLFFLNWEKAISLMRQALSSESFKEFYGIQSQGFSPQLGLATCLQIATTSFIMDTGYILCAIVVILWPGRRRQESLGFLGAFGPFIHSF